MICLLVSCTFCFAGDELKKENDGFTWTLCMTSDSIASALDAKGQEIIPAERGYRYIKYVPESKDKYIPVASCFIVSYFTDGKIEGACNKKGEEIVPVEYMSVTPMKNKKLSYYMVHTPDSLYGILDENGRTLVPARYYNNMPVSNNDRFHVLNETDNIDELTSITVSNSIKDYYQQQKLLTEANEKGVVTDDLLFEAFNLEESGNTKKAIAKLSEAIKKKPSSLAYYHRGLCYYQDRDWKKAQEDLRYVFFLDDATPEITELADSVLGLADQEMMGKKIRRLRRLNTWNTVLSAMTSSMDQNASLIQGSNSSQSSGSTPTSTGLSSLSEGRSANASSGVNHATASQHQGHSKRCHSCGGDGKCRGKYHCHGTGVCNYCNGKGTQEVQGNVIKCVNCNGTGKCSFCRGSKVCQRCKGNGNI